MLRIERKRKKERREEELCAAKSSVIPFPQFALTLQLLCPCHLLDNFGQLWTTLDNWTTGQLDKFAMDRGQGRQTHLHTFISRIRTGCACNTLQPRVTLFSERFVHCESSRLLRLWGVCRFALHFWLVFNA